MPRKQINPQQSHQPRQRLFTLGKDALSAQESEHHLRISESRHTVAGNEKTNSKPSFEESLREKRWWCPCIFVSGLKIEAYSVQGCRWDTTSLEVMWSEVAFFDV